MKKSFMYIAQHASRKLVVHQVLDAKSLMSKLAAGDLVFFDDCLYSQYLFLKENAEELAQKNIACVVSFSTKISRKDGCPLLYAVCAECHDKLHSGDMSALQAYMSVDELKELLCFSNVYLACHGAQHLKLSDVQSKYMQAKLFKEDLLTAAEDLKKLDLSTSIYVFPYAYSSILNAHKLLRCNGFISIFADEHSKRIQIEDLEDE